VFEPTIGPEEIAAVVEALQRGEISGSFGRFLERFEEEFARFCGARYGVATTSGTTALHLAAAVLGIQAGDEVLVPACTNIATALAAYHQGAVVVPVDSEPETWNMNLDLLDELWTPRVRAVMPVHLFGHPVDMDRLMEWARRRGVWVIEDCAQAHGSLCRGRPVGSFGHIACFSFYANKVITTGEGGMLVTSDRALYERARLLRNLAFTQPRFYHEVPGYNYRMTGYQAAMGLVQLGKIDRIIAEKRRVAATYSRYLADIPGLQLPIEREWARNVFWMYAVVVTPEFPLSRDDLLSRLAGLGIETRTFFCPMNQQPFLRSRLGSRAVACPVADRLWECGFYLPSSINLSEETIRWIADCVRECAGK
jgi:perosamine synthetase